MPAIRLTKTEMRRKRRTQEIRERRMQSIEATIRDPRKYVKHATSLFQRRLIEDHMLMPLSVLSRANRMPQPVFNWALRNLLAVGLVKTLKDQKKKMDNVVFWTDDAVWKEPKRTTMQFEDERIGPASVTMH